MKNLAWNASLALSPAWTTETFPVAASNGISHVYKPVLHAEFLCHMLSYRLYTVTFGGVMSGSDELYALFPGRMHSLL
jgi:hypothetical protein